MSKHSSGGQHWQYLRTLVLDRDGHVCVVCNAPATHVDHILPKSKGGEDSMDNLQAMCATHNLKKGNKTTSMRGTYWAASLLPQGLPSPEGKNTK